MLTPNELTIHGGVHKFCESHSIFYPAHLTTDRCPMCEREQTNAKLVLEITNDLEHDDADHYHTMGVVRTKLGNIQ